MIPCAPQVKKQIGERRKRLTENKIRCLKFGSVELRMKTPPMGVPASAPVDIATKIIPTRPPTSSTGDICTTHACEYKYH
jgi:hypothetical protein